MTKIFAFLFVCLFSFSASANIMTFKDVPRIYGPAPYIEDGITANTDGGDYIASFYGGSSAHIDAKGTAYANKLILTMDSRFDAIGFNPGTPSYDYYVEVDNVGTRLGYESVYAKGIRNNVVIASRTFWGGSYYFFSDDFKNLDTLIIGLSAPVIIELPRLRTFCLDYCSHTNFGNIELSPIPLPPSIILFGAALVCLGGLRFRRRATK